VTRLNGVEVQHTGIDDLIFDHSDPDFILLGLDAARGLAT